MQNYLDSLIPLAAQPHLIPAEQIITTHLLPFETIFSEEQQDSKDDSIQEKDDLLSLAEQVLLPLFNINEGFLSLPCSIRIANCLIFLYEKSNKPEKWNFISYLSLKLNSASIYGLGQIIDFVGDQVESQIPQIVKMLLDNYNDVSGSNFFSKKSTETNILYALLPTLFALNSCFKRSHPSLMQPFKNATFAIAKQASLSNDEPLQLSGLKLLRTLIKKTDLPTSSFLNVATQVFKNIDDEIIVSTTSNMDSTKSIVVNLENDNFYISIGSQSHYVYLDACYFVARLAYVPFVNLEPEEQRREWTITTPQDESNNSRNELKESFEILKQFPRHFKVILSRFLDLLEPQTVHKNLFALYEFVREVNEQELPQVMSLFGHDVKKTIFQRVACEQPPTKEQLDLLISLYCGFDSTREIAALALQLANSGVSSSRRRAAEFFAELDEWDPDLAEKYIDSSLLCLAYPPEDETHSVLENEIIGFATVASSILGMSPDRVELAFDNADKINLFLSRFLKVEDVLNPTFEACFVLMTVLPEKIIPKELTSEALSRLAGFIEGEDYRISNSVARLNEVCRSAAVFLAQHPYFEVLGRLFWHMISLPNLPSRSGNLAIIISAPYALEGTSKLANISYMLVEHILSVRPSNDLIFSMLKHPIRKSNFEPPPPDLIFSYVPKNEFAYRIINNYPDFILSLKPETATRTISKLLMSRTNLCMSHLLLLSLVMNDKIKDNLLPKGFHQSLYDTLNDDSDIMRLFITAEIIAIHAKARPKRIQSFVRIIDSINFQSNDSHIIVKCVLLAALFSHVSLDGETITNFMHELDGIAMMSEEYTIFALHALSIIFIEHGMKVSLTEIVDIQSQVLFNLLNSSHVFYPEEMEMVANAFSNYLPIASPEIEVEGSSLVPFIKIIVQSFQNVPLPFARHFTFSTMQSVSAFAPKLANNFATLEFPTARGISTNLQLVASAAFSDLLRVSPDKAPADWDFFEYLEDSLVNLQRTGDSRASDFIIAIAQNFADHFDPDADMILNMSADSFADRTHSTNEIMVDTDFENHVSISPPISISPPLSPTFMDTNGNLIENSVVNMTGTSMSVSEADVDQAVNKLESPYGMARFAEWIHVIKTILANGALPFTGGAVIEAVRTVKICALKIIDIILPLLERIELKQKFPVDFLTDIMTSVIRAIETRKKSLSTRAYAILNMIIDMFKDKLLNPTDNNIENVNVNLKKDKKSQKIHILSLYDSQFSIAVRYGFQMDLSISGEFLVSFLWFHLENLKTKTTLMKVILDSYVKGLEKCKQRTIQYVGIAACIADIAREHPDLTDEVKTFVTKAMPLFADVIHESMQIFGISNSSTKETTTQKDKKEDTTNDKKETTTQKDKKEDTTNDKKETTTQKDKKEDTTNDKKETTTQKDKKDVSPQKDKKDTKEVPPNDKEKKEPASQKGKKEESAVQQPDWQAISQFRTNYSEYYGDLLSSFVWFLKKLNLESKFNIELTNILQFCIDEIEISNTKTRSSTPGGSSLLLATVEPWRVSSAFEALAVIIDIYPEKVSLSVLEHAVDVVRQMNEASPEFLEYALPLFLRSSVKKITNDVHPQMWCHLMEAALNLSYIPEVLGVLLVKGRKEKILLYADQVFDDALEATTNPLYIAVVTILIDKVPEKSASFIETLMNIDQNNLSPIQPEQNNNNNNENDNMNNNNNNNSPFLNDLGQASDSLNHWSGSQSPRSGSPPFVYSITDEWKLTVLEMLLKKLDDPEKVKPETMNKVSLLIWKRFKLGGMKLITKIIPRSLVSHKAGFRILSFGNLRFIEKIIHDEYENARAYLQFLRFCFDESKDDFLLNDNDNSEIDKYTMFIMLIRIAIRTISTFGSTDRRVVKTISLAINLLNEAREANPELFKDIIFKKVGHGELKFSIELIEKTMSNQNKGKGMKLKKFSLTKREDINDIENEDGVPIPNTPPTE